MELITKNKKSTRWIIFLFVFVISLYSLVKKDFQKSKRSVFENVMISLVGPMQSAISSGENTVNNIWNTYIANINARLVFKKQQNQIDELENRIFSLKEIKKENQRLRAILNHVKNKKLKVIVAEVKARDTSNLFKMIRINKGVKDGVKAELAVYTPRGIVGFIYKVFKNYSDVILLIDSNSRIEVLVGDGRSHGILEGYSSNLCLIKYVDQNENIKLGDIVISSGLGDIYPKGLMVGTVSKIRKESFGITQTLFVEPLVDFNRLEEVLIGINSEK